MSSGQGGRLDEEEDGEFAGTTGITRSGRGGGRAADLSYPDPSRQALPKLAMAHPDTAGACLAPPARAAITANGCTCAHKTPLQTGW